MTGAGIGTWIALISCPVFALLILIVLFRSDGGPSAKRKKKPRTRLAEEPPAPKRPKVPLAISAEPDCVQLQITAQRAASAAGAAVLTARGAAKAAAQTAGELARLTAVRDNARAAHEAVKTTITAMKAALAAKPDQGGADDPAQREVSRAALAAYRRGDISVDELHAVWKRVDGWDEVREEQERELNRLRSEEIKTRKALDAAESALGPARRDAQSADGVARARSQEATAADQAARAAYARAEECRQKSLRQGTR